jgi:hypothetical protein
MAKYSFSAVMGISVIRIPVAWKMALAMAGATGMSVGSPIPLAP